MATNIPSKPPAPAASSTNSAASRANYDHQSGGGGGGGSSNSASSSWRRNSNLPVSYDKKGKLEESDEDLFTVPDVEAQQLPSHMDTESITQNNNSTSGNNNNNNNKDQQTNGKRRRGRNPVDREHRRLKRLLRNRVSAQQARERKKVYLSDLESRASELQDRNSELEEKISTLTNENTMLRKVLLNTRPKADESNQPNQ